jgi:broad-specificity NMP kinase
MSDSGVVGATLRDEMRRILGSLAAHVDRQRRRGRTPAVDALGGLVIEEGEAEGLIADVAASLSEESTRAVTIAGIKSGSLRIDHAGGMQSPLWRAREAFELTPAEYDALILALAVEVDGRFARLVAFLNDHGGRTRPTLGLAVTLSGSGAMESPVALAERPMVRDGLIELDAEGPLSGQTLRVPRDLLARLTEDAPAVADLPGVRVHARDPRGLDALVLEPGVYSRLARWSATARSVAAPVLVIAGAPGAGRATAARAALSAAGLPAIEVRVAAELIAERLLVARREARWHAAGIVVRIDGDVRELEAAAIWRELAGVSAPVAVVASPVAAAVLAAWAPAEPMTVAIAAPDLDGRARVWAALTPAGALSAGELDQLASRFEFSPRMIARAIQRATAHRGNDRDAAAVPSYADIMRACRELGSAGMGSIAQRMALPYGRGDLVLPAQLLIELDLALAWVLHKRTVFGTWGFGKRLALGRGLTALFTGPPGTGKTMTAQVLAHELSLELYRVDLSQVMSKYIGETEKNLARLFEEARSSGAVLFFDEADAIFGKRSQVKDAHDRYANIEIGYLLQRMEEHEGAAILATNRRGDLDDAFIRRFHFILEFPMPTRDERLRLWRGMLPREADVEPELDLETLADEQELSGGEIRNCVLAAAYLAAAEGRPIGNPHLRRGLVRELRKSGKMLVDRGRRSGA